MHDAAVSDAAASCGIVTPSAANYRKTSSCTKPDIHNLLLRRQSRTKPRLPATCIENLMKFGCVVSEICVQTGRETGRNTGQPQLTNSVINETLQQFAPLSDISHGSVATYLR